MIPLAVKYALDIPAILECVDNNYQIHPFFEKWEIKWNMNASSATGSTIREALDNFKRTVVSVYVDPEQG